MKMELIQVDQGLCVRCGNCAAVCTRGIINMGKEGPEYKEPEGCIACGHCVAVCAYSALSNIRTPLAGQIPMVRFPVVDGTYSFDKDIKGGANGYTS